MKLLKLKKQEFMYFMMIVFVFVSTTAISVSGKVNIPEEVTNLVTIDQPKYYPDNPVLAAETSYPVISAQGVLAVDLDSGIPLYEKNADAELLPASTTKIVTALVAFDVYTPEQVLKIPKGVRVDGQKIGLYEGEEMTVENVLNALLVYSANDAAETLARAYPDGYDKYIDLMNAKAKELGMNNSHFYNPAGLDGAEQYSTAKDLVRATEVALRNPLFAKIVGTKETTVVDTSGKNTYKIKNINKLLGTVEGVEGVKTGWTENARENLVTYVNRNGHKVLIALLGSSDRFGETTELINWIYGSYDWQQVHFP